jgi:alpha-galactosidase/6-phospho-beta-glucosidase family protein
MRRAAPALLRFADPLVPDLPTARGLLDDLLAAHAAYLSRFQPRFAVAA